MSPIFKKTIGKRPADLSAFVPIGVSIFGVERNRQKRGKDIEKKKERDNEREKEGKERKKNKRK